MRLVQVADMVASLQAKVIARLLEPERLVWKDFAAIHMSRGRQWLAAHQHISPRTVDMLAYGTRVIFSTRRTQDLGISSSRFRAYIAAYRRLQPHRQILPTALTLAQVLVEPLFHNLQIRQAERPLTPSGPFQMAAQHGLTAVGDLQAPPQGLDTTLLDSIRQALPEHWRRLLDTDSPVAHWFQPADRTDILVSQATSSDGLPPLPVWTAYTPPSLSSLLSRMSSPQTGHALGP